MERREFKLPRLDYHIAENAEHPACLLIEEESGLTVATFTLSERGVSHCMRLVGEHNQHAALVEQRDRLADVLRRALKAIEVIDFSPCREGSYDSIPWQDIEHALATAAQSHEPQAKGGSGGEG